jgi:hypothetical protein
VDLPFLYSSADVVVIPSRGEGWGRPHVEAMVLCCLVLCWALTTVWRCTAIPGSIPRGTPMITHLCLSTCLLAYMLSICVLYTSVYVTTHKPVYQREDHFAHADTHESSAHIFPYSAP